MSEERPPLDLGTESPSEKQVDKKDLKIQALLEKLIERENDVADLRVELTIMSQELEGLKKYVSENGEESPAF